jgi:hypothetical protein
MPLWQKFNFYNILLRPLFANVCKTNFVQI